MTFLIKPPHRIKKKLNKEAQSILDNLARYLDENSEEPIEMLCGFWKDQQSAITYQELRKMVKAGLLTENIFRQWSNDYSVLVQKQMTPIWNSAISAGSLSQPIVNELEFMFETQTPGLMRWVSERGAEFVTASTIDQRKAIASLLEKKVTDEYTVDELARLIRPCIGLTDGDSKATLRYYDNIVKTLKEQHPRMKPESVRKKALDAATKYAEKKHRARAFTIAQTEMAFAYNRGADEGVRQAQQNNLLGTCEKRWITSGDDQVCQICAALDGTQIGMDDNFDFKGRLLFTGQKLVPPAHPRCGCAVQYIETSVPVYDENTTPEYFKAEDFKGKGDFELTGNVEDLHLTDGARSRIEEATKEVRSASDLQEYLNTKGIMSETPSQALRNRWNEEIPSVKEHIDYIIAAVEQYEDIGGLSSVKVIHFWDTELETQGQYSYRARGEGVVDDEGHIYISNRANGFQVMHEFAHAYADSTKPTGMDLVEWSAELNRAAGLSEDATAYFGAEQSVIEAEKFADAIGGAIAYGNQGTTDRLGFLTNVANIILSGRPK